MKAAVLTRYGKPDAVQIKEIETPSIKEDQVLIKIHAASVTFADVEFRVGLLPFYFRFLMRLIFGIFRPRGNFILGQEISGTVVEVGQDVSLYKVGDEVLGAASWKFGGHAEYIALEGKERSMRVHKPKEISHLEAATIPLGAPHAIYFLKKADIKPGMSVLINGAGGTIGSYAIQVAKLQGAEVTAVDGTNKLEMMKQLGADHVIDYTQHDFADLDDRYDVVFDVVGRRSFSRCINVLKPNGMYLSSNPMIHHQWKGIFAKRKGYRIFSGVIDDDVKWLKQATDLAAKGDIKSWIDRTYRLDEIAEAHRYAETGDKIGHLVLDMTDNTSNSE